MRAGALIDLEDDAALAQRGEALFARCRECHQNADAGLKDVSSLAYIGDGKVSMLHEFPVKPSALMATMGWHTSVGIDYEVVGLSKTKAHLVLKRCTRVRRDGSAIEDVFAFYAWTRTSGGWKMFAVSDVTVPRRSGVSGV